MSGLDSERIRWARYRRRGPPSIAQSRHTKGNACPVADTRRPFVGAVGRLLRVLPYVSLHRKLALLLPLVVFVLALDDIGDRVNLILQGFVLRFEFVDAPPILRVSSALA
jgi:hypothetical protein